VIFNTEPPRKVIRVFSFCEVKTQKHECGTSWDCEWTSRPERRNISDAVFYEMSQGLDCRKAIRALNIPPSHPLPVMHSMEAFEGRPWQTTLSQYYPILFTYRQNDTIPNTYYNWYNWRRQFPNHFAPPAVLSSAISGATFIAQNCKSSNGREDWVRELRKHILVHSFGGCLRNMEWPKDVKTGHNYDYETFTKKIQILKKYKLHFAFENTNGKDYVTEKVYSALAAGVIPVYFGAPNILEYIPDPTSIIDLNSFATREEAVNYVVQVLSNKTLYDYHHKWRERPLPKWFVDKFESHNDSVPCMLCKYLYNNYFNTAAH